MKRITAFFLFAFAGIVGTHAALAQEHSVKATMPFNFTVGSTHLPAGTYRVISVRDDLVQIANQQTRASILSAASFDSEQPANGAELVFNKYGDQYFLSEILGGAFAINVSLPTAKLEKQARHQQNMANNQSQISVAAEGL
jgi:hypothetical protein